MARASALVVMTAAAATASAQISISALNTPVTENFDGMGTAAAASLPAGFQWNRGDLPAEAPPNPVGFDWNATDFRTATIARAGTTGTGVFTGSTSGSTFNLANGVADTDTDRAIGFMGSSSFPSSLDALANNSTRTFHLFANYQNNTGSTVQSITLNWDYEKYRSGSRIWNWTFSYSFDGVTWVSAAPGDQSYPADSANTTVFNPPQAVAKSVTINSLGLANAGQIYFRWTLNGVGGSSNGQALGVDNLSVSASAVNAPSLVVDQTAFTSYFGITRQSVATPSTAPYPSFTLAGENLTTDVVVTAPTGFQVSTDEATWLSVVNVAVPPANPSSTIYVRFNPATTGFFSGNVTVASTGVGTSTVGVSGLSAEAPISIAAVNTAYTQNFDALPNTGSTGVVSSQSPLAGWYMVRSVAPPLLGSIAAFDGSNSTGGLYAYGTGTDTDRALGILNSAAVGAGAYGAIFKNNTGVTITDLRVQFTGEQWRQGGNVSAQALEFYYTSSATPITTFTAAADLTNVGALNFFSPILNTPAPDPLTPVALDGNLPANQVAFDQTISSLTIAPGDEILIKWVDLDHGGNDHGLAIDNFSLTANPGAGPVFPDGDANGDLVVDVADVTLIYNVVNTIVAGPVPGDGDVDEDADVDAADANAIIQFLVNGTPLP